MMIKAFLLKFYYHKKPMMTSGGIELSLLTGEKTSADEDLVALITYTNDNQRSHKNY